MVASVADYIGDDETDLLPPLTDEEQAQLAGLRPPGLRASPGPMPSAPRSTVQPPPITGPANARLQEVLGERPVLTQPKWWQRLAGAAAGGAAGYSNASGRMRNPIDIDQLTQNILAPGYNSKLAEWQSRVAPLEQQAQLETAKNQAWWKNASEQANIAEKGAKADYERGLGRSPMIEVTPAMEETSGGIFKAGTKIPAATATELARVAAGKYEKPEKTMVVTDPDLAGVMGVKPGTAVPNSLYQAAVTNNNKKAGNVNEWQMYLDASGGDPKKAIEAWRQDKINVAKQSRPPAANTTIMLSPEAKDRAADLYNDTGVLQNYGYGAAGAQMKQDVMNRAAEKAKVAGAGGADTRLSSAKTDYASNAAAIKDMERNFSRIKISEGTAERNLDLADAVSKRVDRTGSPLLNKYLLYLKGQVAGDTDTQLLDNAVETAANEYAGVVTAGSGGGIAATDSSRQHARDMLHSSMANGTFSKVVAQMKQEMGNRRASFEESLKGARAGRGGAKPSQGAPASQAPIIQHSPSTGAYRYSLDGGKTWQAGQPK